MIDLLTPSSINVGSEIEQLLEQITEEKSKFDKLRPLDSETESRIKMSFLPDRVTASLNMEGIVATRRQTLAIMDGMTISENSTRTEQEILNALKADELTFEQANQTGKLSENLIREINGLIEAGIGENSGAYRTKPVQISQAEFTPPDHFEVPALVEELVRVYNTDGAVHPIVKAAWIHARFTHIHPFLDGNGRTGRLLQDFALLSGQLFPTGIPSSLRDDYYDALAGADNNDWQQLLEILALRQLEVIAKASGIAQERKQRSSWIEAIAKRANEKKASSQHKNFLVWSHKMAEIRSAFEDTARELSSSSNLISVKHENYDSLDFRKWQEICSAGRAPRTWYFSQSFFVDGEKIFRCIFYFKRHYPLSDDTFVDQKDTVSMFLTGGDHKEDYNFFRFEDSSIRLREILFDYENMITYYFSGKRLEDESERWSPDGPLSMSSVVQDFYEDVLQHKAGV